MGKGLVSPPEGVDPPRVPQLQERHQDTRVPIESVREPDGPDPERLLPVAMKPVTEAQVHFCEGSGGLSPG